jgi:DNA-directed RNA polymerase specialized sigma subunit
MKKTNDSDQDSRNRRRGRGKIKIVKRQHVNNEELKNELIKFKKSVCEKHPNGLASERLGEIFLDLVDNYATKSNFSGYSYLDEMKSRATFFLLMYSKSFNPEKSDNAFAYCTQIVKNAFIQVIKKEKKHTETKKALVEKYFKEKDHIKKDDTLIIG